MPERPRKRFVSSMSSEKDWRKALRAVADDVRAGLGGGPCDLALLFVSETYYGADPAALTAELSELLTPRALLGCNASGVIGGAVEVEMEPAISLMGMRLPDVRVAPFHLTPAGLASMRTGASLVESLDLYPTEKPKFLCLGEPMSCDIEALLGLFNEGYPGCPVVGGLASAPVVGRQSWLALGTDILTSGAACAALSGDIELEVVVAQGCRPIGTPFTITKAEDNVVYELAGRPALEVVREVIAQSPPGDRVLARHSLFAGLVIDENHPGSGPGGFLIRNLLGFDAEKGALMVGSNLRVGQTLQFQLRDARTSAEDLAAHLGGKKAPGEAGALLVSCCGRGRGLYGRPNHDSELVQDRRGPLPLAGFFANGEIGPVSGRNFVHGYTSSFVVLR